MSESPMDAGATGAGADAMGFPGPVALGFRARDGVGSGSKNGPTATGLLDESGVHGLVLGRHPLR